MPDLHLEPTVHPAGAWPETCRDCRTTPTAPAGLREALDSALTELDNIRWDDIWPHLYGGSPSSQELARMSMKYVGYVRSDIEKALAAIASPSEDPGLDVERLAHALANDTDDADATERRSGDLWSLLSERLRGTWRIKAEEVAAEYASLAKEPGR